MSSIHEAHCVCGFKTSVNVGGLRATFRKKCYYPYYCKECGLVEVNTAKKNLLCPSCKSEDVVAYGDDKISIKSEDELFPTIQCFQNRAFKTGNLCPQCKKQTLVFEHADMLFD